MSIASIKGTITVANFFNSHNLPNHLSIANTNPDWYIGPTESVLKPGQMVWDLKKGDITEQEYMRKYLERLKLLTKIGYDWSKLIDMTLLCWCKQGDFCHRYILADYLEQEHGFKIERK